MRRVSFCDGWEFSRNGGAFERVSVPHDAMLGERRGPDAPAGSANGYFFGGVYRYRKAFSLTEDEAAGAVALEFEGVYRNACIAVNGEAVPGVPPYGFSPFVLDLTGRVRPGENIIEVEVDVTAQPDLRWYSGAGLYRPVWLWTGPAMHIPPQGVRVSTVSADPPRVRVRVDIAGVEVPAKEAVDLRISVFAADGRRLGERVSACRGATFACELALPFADVWSPEDPALLTCEVILSQAGRVLDEARVRFGVRTVEWGPQGLLINGSSVKLRGGCIHHDNGPLGACSFPEAERRRVAALKELGFNALRMAHNPASGALLDACDELGMFVMDEAWDVWIMPKSAHDYAREFIDNFDGDLARMVARDFNHPSVIMYSIGNEVADPIGPRGLEVERMMVDLLHALDPNRPVTCGFNLTMMVMEKMGRGWYADADEGRAAGEVAPANSAPHGSMLFNLTAQAMGTGMEWVSRAPGADKLISPALDGVDIAGYNYGSPRYAVDARRHPDRLMLGTETYPHHLPANWRLVQRLPHLLGDFMWAAWDYLGEAGANAWCYSAEEAGFSKPFPWIAAGSGCFDLIGTLGAHGALARAVWRPECGPTICVRPVNHARDKVYKGAWRGSDAVVGWSWAGCEGSPAQVEVYDGRAVWVRLELNGRLVGYAAVRDCCARFSVPYEPGVLEAVSLGAGHLVIGRTALRSAEGELRLGLHAEERAATDELVFVQVRVEGENGEVECNADEWLAAEVTGGELLAFASGNPAEEEPFAAPRVRTFYGRALAILRPDGPGAPWSLTVRGESLAPVTLG